ncbi:phospholipase D-like domain-containing protein [Parasphingorhabdus pacifica]
MDSVPEGGAARKWLLTAAERGNPATELDRREADDAAWSVENQVQLLVDGQEYFHLLRAELADTTAGDQVYVSAFIGDPAQRLEASQPSIGAECARALDAGVIVRGLFWCPYLDVRKDFVPQNRSFVDLLDRLGGFAVLDQRIRAFGSHHQKFVVIRRPGRPDSDVALIGGIDPCPSRRDDSRHQGDPQVLPSIAGIYGSRPAWHDAHLVVRGPAVAAVEHCFRERWHDTTSSRRQPFHRIRQKLRTNKRGRVALPNQLPAPHPCGSHAVQLLRTYPSKIPRYPFAPRGEMSVARGYVKALRNARRFIYVEDQFLWSPMVAEIFADALRREPALRMVAVLPSRPDKAGKVHVATSDVAHRKALDLLYAAGGDRVDVYELENTEGLPIYVHSKVCVVDDVWATVGSANLNRRSWTYDSELTAAVVEESCPDGSRSHGFAKDMRLRLLREHLGREADEDEDLVDPEQATEVLRGSATALEKWHTSGRASTRPPGQLRFHTRPRVSRLTRAWAGPLGRVVMDPDGQPPWRRGRERW